MGAPVALDRRQAPLGIPPLEHHYGPPGTVDQRTTHNRRRVIERRRGQICVVRRVREPRVDPQAGSVADGPVRQREHDPLGPSRRSRRVEHPRAFGLVVGWCAGHPRCAPLVALPALKIAVEHERDLNVDELHLSAADGGRHH
jgi:hypothetical protein